MPSSNPADDATTIDDTESEINSSSSEDEEVDARLENMVTSKPLYYILAQYLETASGRNLADCLMDLVDAIKSLEGTVKTLKQ